MNQNQKGDFRKKHNITWVVEGELPVDLVRYLGLVMVLI